MKKILLVMIGMFAVSCGGTNTDSYSSLLEEGWAAFESGDYVSAYDQFSAAISTDETRSEAYIGRGWTMMRRDSLDAAIRDFESGSSDPGDVSPDLYAGWAFALNALHQYVLSNTQAAEAVTGSNEGWSFEHDDKLNIEDLRILEAENFFAMGNFSASLLRVQLINSNFSANVSSVQGQAQLAAEIERLRSL